MKNQDNARKKISYKKQCRIVFGIICTFKIDLFDLVLKKCNNNRCLTLWTKSNTLHIQPQFFIINKQILTYMELQVQVQSFLNVKCIFQHHFNIFFTTLIQVQSAKLKCILFCVNLCNYFTILFYLLVLQDSSCDSRLSLLIK